MAGREDAFYDPPPNASPAAPIFVPVALKLDEAQALFNAARSVFGALTMMHEAAANGGELARGMVTLAKAIDKVTGAEV